MSTVFCNQCGHQNPPGSNFCSSCGAPLDLGRDDRTIVFHHVDALQESSTSEDDVVVHLNELPAEAGVLLVRSGPQAGMRLLLDDITVSRRHAEIARAKDGGYLVRDVGSLNGTYVNRERVEERSLVHGDELQVGKFKMVYLSGPDAA